MNTLMNWLLQRQFLFQNNCQCSDTWKRRPPLGTKTCCLQWQVVFIFRSFNMRLEGIVLTMCGLRRTAVFVSRFDCIYCQFAFVYNLSFIKQLSKSFGSRPRKKMGHSKTIKSVLHIHIFYRHSLSVTPETIICHSLALSVSLSVCLSCY